MHDRTGSAIGLRKLYRGKHTRNAFTSPSGNPSAESAHRVPHLALRGAFPQAAARLFLVKTPCSCALMLAGRGAAAPPGGPGGLAPRVGVLGAEPPVLRSHTTCVITVVAAHLPAHPLNPSTAMGLIIDVVL